MNLKDLDERISDIENWIYNEKFSTDSLIFNQLLLTETLNRLLEYTNKLFDTGIEPLDIIYEEEPEDI